MKSSSKKTIMVVVAHPDDEVLGCGGTLSKLYKTHEIIVVILGVGKDSRKNGIESLENEKIHLKSEAISANEIIGCNNVIFGAFPDNQFDSVPSLDLTKFIEEIKKEILPDIVFTHFRNDLNIDHRITYGAVLTATRPMEEESVKEIYSFEILSSTEWNYPTNFSPNLFVDITKQLPIKLKAMEEYKSELRSLPHPRSLKGIEANAKYWAFRNGIDGYVEAFEVVRITRSDE